MDESIIKKEPLGNGFFINVSKHHTFGTDAVLLADFANAKKADRLIDLGTGCGIIPFLMLRDGNLKTAEENGAYRFTALNADLNDLKGRVDFGCHTLITCNPPYKAPGAGLKNPDGVCAAARHEVACTLSDIISVSARLLQTSGRLCMCQRPERLAEITAIMRANKLEPKRLRLVCKKVGEEPWLILIEGRKCGNTGLRIEPTLYVYENGEYSPEMIRIYGPYKEAYL